MGTSRRTYERGVRAVQRSYREAARVLGTTVAVNDPSPHARTHAAAAHAGPKAHAVSVLSRAEVDILVG